MKLAIIGGGGHGRELAAIALASTAGEVDISFWDDQLASGEQPFGRVGGSISDLLQSDRSHYLIGVGDPTVRSKIADRMLQRKDIIAYTAVHPSVSLGPRTSIGPGSVVGPLSVLTCDVRIGEHTHLHSNVVISHDCEVGSFVVITPGVSIAGDVEIGDSAWLGVGSSVNRGVRVGERSVVGAGAVVIGTVDPDDVVAGVPARSLNPDRQR